MENGMGKFAAEVVHNSFGEGVDNRVSRFAGKFLDSDASSLLGAGWDKVKETAKQTVVVIGVLAAALYFYEHSRWHNPDLKVVEPKPLDQSEWEKKMKEREEQQRKDYIAATAEGVAEGMKRAKEA